MDNSCLEQKNNRKKSNRCLICKKKMLIVRECKCNQIFCLKHLQPELHNCNHDYSIEKQNMFIDKIISNKIEKI